MKTYRIYKKNKYFTICVFETDEDMYRYVNKKHGSSDKYRAGEYGALFFDYDKYKYKLGTIYFSEESFDLGIISHEILHAAMWYDRYINKNTNAKYGPQRSDKDEILAYLLQDLMTRFINKIKNTHLKYLLIR